MPITLGDIAFMVEELYRGRSAITGVVSRLVLIRWRKPGKDVLVRIGEGKDEQKSIRTRLCDLVCMTKEEAARHLDDILLGSKTLEELYDASVIDRVEARLKKAEEYEKYR